MISLLLILIINVRSFHFKFFTEAFKAHSSILSFQLYFPLITDYCVMIWSSGTSTAPSFRKCAITGKKCTFFFIYNFIFQVEKLTLSIQFFIPPGKFCLYYMPFLLPFVCLQYRHIYFSIYFRKYKLLKAKYL